MTFRTFVKTLWKTQKMLRNDGNYNWRNFMAYGIDRSRMVNKF